MLAKRSTRALALLLVLPSAAFALGLGDIRLLSPLNAPLDAEIELVDVAPDEVNTVQAQIAPRETFARYGLEWPAYLAGVQVRTVRSPDGHQIIKLKSSDPVSEPFVTLLVQVNWSRGQLVREYTMLLDPPVYTPGSSAVASAPVSAPASGAGTREGSIARAAPAASPPPAPAPEPAAAAPVTAPAAAAPEPPPEQAAAAPAPAPSAPAPAAATGSSDEGGTHTVHRGETLSQIAAGVAGDKAYSAKARSWMLAIYQANPKAFDNNMNVLRSGSVLRMPDAAQVSAVSASEATSEIRRQYAAWRGEAAPAAAAAAAEPGRLKLVTPSEGASAGTAPAAPNGQTAALQNRVKDLEGQVAEQKRLMDLKDADLARLQAQLAAKQAPAQQPPAQAAPPAPPPSAPAATPAPAEQPPAQAAPPPAAEEKAPAPAPEAVPPAPKPAPTPVTKAPAPSGGGSILDYWWVALLALLALVGFGASRVLRARRASAFDDSLGRLAVAGADAAEAEREPIVPVRGFASGDAPVRPTPAAAAEPAFLVEETGTHERPRFTPGGAPAPAAKHVASDETISSETAINLDQGDPLAEADFHMAYGLYDQAADLIRIAISREPARRDLKLKLLEVFFVWGNKEQFLQTARELAESRADAAPGEWEKILIMGKQLAPEDPLFSGSGAVSGAAAAGVDLDLEGGQSRVDFDLLGEPVPAEGGQGVDLDLGSALGDRDPTTESPTNVTDRNVALADNTFSSSSGSTGTFASGTTGTFAGATTGTTRQMTQRMRPDSTGSTAEMEGPTVEQPQLRSNDNPTIRQKLETALKQGAGDQTAELAIDDLGLDVGQVDTVDQPGIASASASTPDAPTLVAGMDDRSRRVMEDARQRAVKEETGSTTGAWQFDQDEIEAALTSTSLQMPDVSATSRLAALSKHDVDVDLGDATGTHQSVSHSGSVDLDVGDATGTHPSNGGLDLDVGTATVPDAAFAATQRLASEDLALPDLEPVTMSEVGTKLDLARAYMDMGDPDGARNILEEVLNEGSAAQKQEAQRLMESLPG